MATIISACLIFWSINNISLPYISLYPQTIFYPNVYIHRWYTRSITRHIPLPWCTQDTTIDVLPGGRPILRSCLACTFWSAEYMLPQTQLRQLYQVHFHIHSGKLGVWGGGIPHWQWQPSQQPCQGTCRVEWPVLASRGYLVEAGMVPPRTLRLSSPLMIFTWMRRSWCMDRPSPGLCLRRLMGCAQHCRTENIHLGRWRTPRQECLLLPRLAEAGADPSQASGTQFVIVTLYSSSRRFSLRYPASYSS